MSDLNHLIGLAVRDKVIADCQTPYPTTDLSRVNEVTFGRYRGDEAVDSVSVAILPGNWDKAEARSGIITMFDYEDSMGLRLPGRQIGGGASFWYLHGVAEVRCNYVKARLDQETASDKAFITLGRVEQAISNVDVRGVTDEFGKIAGEVFVYGRRFVESGRDPQILWKGMVFWAVYCQVPYF